MAMSLFRSSSIVCNLGWGVLMAKRCFTVVSHMLDVSKFSGLCDLCIR